MNELFESAKKRMNKTFESLSSEYISIRAGRANPSILDKITVDYYGTSTPINQVASISITEARILTIQPWDASITGAIEKAIQKSDMGINPQSDGKVVRVIFPQLTEDKRKEISKDISKMAEESKIAVRNVRRDIIDKLKAMKKNSEITEDDLKHSEKKVQDLTDKFCSEIDLLCEKKTKQIIEM
jgi:ribosome recycling factor